MHLYHNLYSIVILEISKNKTCLYLCGLILKLPVPLVFTVLRFDDMIKVITSTVRIKRNHWMKNLT